MARTYLPTLVFLLQKMCDYITKHRETLTRFLPDGGSAALDGLLLACAVFMALVPPNTAP